jgi:peptidoglycan/xylan/chitin deacetylase (PgdA/CDA1 family)
MDDMGSSDKTYYSVWHYPSLSEAQIRRALIEPLQKHGAMLGQNVNTGYLDRKTRRVLNPWRQTAVPDELDPAVVHDFASTKRGLDAGVRAGVFEIHSHGWTHMAPDLDSPPGPFWPAPATSAIIQLNWYKEFTDIVRAAEVPAAMQRLHLRRSLADLAEDFGVRPLMLRCGGGGVSTSAAHNTMRIAAGMGFGLAHGDRHYFLSHELCVPLDPVSPEFAWNYSARLPAAEIPWTIDAPCWIGTHDRDVALDEKSFAQLLDDLGPGVRYLSYREYAGYLHARVERVPAAAGALALRVGYDPHYCGYFQDHASRWVLHLSDDTRRALKTSAPERRVVELSPGLGFHTIQP